MQIPDKIKIGTRGSLLALKQTDLFTEQIKKIYPQIVCEKVIIKTKGDKILDRPLLSFGGKGVFVTEFEEALINGTIDYAVHSAKDMPADLMDGLEIVCVLKREDARDVLLARKDHPIDLTTEKIVIGTGSLRRQIQFRQIAPFAEFIPLRGNVTTRIEKLKNKECDGIILAAAGIKRLDLTGDTELDYTYFDVEEMIPAGGQAIIAIEGRTGTEQEFLKAIHDTDAFFELQTERRILKQLDAGCHEAIGIFAQKEKKHLTISLMKEIDGKAVKTRINGATGQWKALADKLVRDLYI